MNATARPRTPDVTLILEGTYPYVRGGVSNCVHQLVNRMPDIQFSIFYIGSQSALAKTPKFDIPPNVLEIQSVFLFDPGHDPEFDIHTSRIPNAGPWFQALAAFYAAPDQTAQLDAFWQLCDAHSKLSPDTTFAELCRDRRAWNTLLRAYHRFAPDSSFVDFFWTTRFLHLPLWRGLRARRRIPRAPILHSLSTGYAGLLASVAARDFGARLLVSEHGIYTRERIEEINRAEWIYEPDSYYFDMSGDWRKLKELWIDKFRFLSSVAYTCAEKITTLYEGNANAQIELGADPHRVHIIPNGIDIGDYDSAWERHQTRTPGKDGWNIVFVGRVVPIKDVKTLLQAAAIVCERKPAAQFHIYGPTEEDADYVADIMELHAALHLEGHAFFRGNGKPAEILVEADILVLTSVSEGLPLVILEAFSAGVPVVATDVGATRELLYGRTPDDRALGPGGTITRITAPLETAEAIVELIESPERVRTMGASGRLRVERYYQEKDILRQYHKLYADLGSSHPAAPHRSHT